MNEATMVVVQIETMAGVEACDQILAVPGVDMVLVGANDLLADMGMPGRFDDPALESAYDAIQGGACTKHGKVLGIGGLSGRPDLVARFVRNGGRFVSTGTDISFLLQAATERAEAVKSLQDVLS